MNAAILQSPTASVQFVRIQQVWGLLEIPSRERADYCSSQRSKLHKLAQCVTDLCGFSCSTFGPEIVHSSPFNGCTEVNWI